jgi:hypothetical protein
MMAHMGLRFASILWSTAFVCACGTASHTQLGTARRAPALPHAAREPFEPQRFDVVFESAVRAVRARGYEIVACDPDFGSITTARTEVDAPCGESTCLAREITTVKLGYRRARVTLQREIWDATLHEWREPQDVTSVDTIDRVERELADAMVRGAADQGLTRLEEACGASSCHIGPCVASAPPFEP